MRSKFAPLTTLRRATAVVAGAVVITGIAATAALAETSPGKVAPGSTTLYWSGQGTPVQQQCDTAADPGAGSYQNGATAGNYELWIFSTDGGSVSAPPTLTINGVLYDHAFKPGSGQSDFGFPGAWQIVTPYIDPATISPQSNAFASYPAVTDIGNGDWVLTISHGCAGPTGQPKALPLTIGKTVTGTFDTTFQWNIKKDATPAEIDQSGGPATFNYVVTVSHDNGTVSNVKVTGNIGVSNTNNADATLSGLTDVLSDGTVCAIDTSGDPSLTVPANGNASFPYTCNLGSVPAITLTNTAVASWNDQTLSNGDFLAANKALVQKDIVFTGNKPSDDCIKVNDTLAGDLGQVCVGDPTNPTVFNYTHTFTGDPAGTCTTHDNTAAFITNTTGTTSSASASVKDCIGADLVVAKDANPAFNRDYQWSINKAVDKTLVQQVGGQATFNYTVNAAETGFTDSGWQVTGKITVTNPNDWESVTLGSLSDSIDNGGVCTVGGSPAGTPLAPAGQASDSASFPYTCTYANAPNPANGTNTATATWDATAAFTPDGSANGTKGFAFDKPTDTTHKTVTVNDTFNGATTALGTLTATDSQPFASASYNYSHTVNVPSFNCLQYTNKAVIVETGQSDSKTVSVCGPLKTGALTMGYWQNKNGQAQITGGSSTAGVCNSGTYLRTFAPFQDLSATANCTTVAAYVTNVIKAANATGAAMNAMLKAQMLSTALDVYFNWSIGSAKIDLTKICKMIDGSGGTATCSGTYENTSSAFGGTSPQTVSALLTYAASQSNSGGSAWYGQVKATQQLAKDTFDAINNQVAFGA